MVFENRIKSYLLNNIYFLCKTIYPEYNPLIPSCLDICNKASVMPEYLKRASFRSYF